MGYTQMFLSAAEELRDARTGCPERILLPREHKCRMVRCRCCGAKLAAADAGKFPDGGAVCFSCYDVDRAPSQPDAALLYTRRHAPLFFCWLWQNLSAKEKELVAASGYHALPRDTRGELEEDFLREADDRRAFLLRFRAGLYEGKAL